VESDRWEKSDLPGELGTMLIEKLDSFTLNARIRDAVLYSMGSGAKLLRPRLLIAAHSDLLVGHASREMRAAVLRASLAVELLHCASLIHDDLPAIDNDDLRRGKPSCHRRFSESTAILAGDFMVGLAFSLFDDSTSMKCVPVLARAWLLLCDGQQRDLEDLNSVEEVDEMIARKTGALFQASTEMGTLLAGAPVDLVRQYGDFGCTFGRAFQALDDVVDGDQRLIDGSAKEYLGAHRQELLEQTRTIESAIGAPSALRGVVTDVFSIESF
jgi:geranylgeranyl pyrophosphate synthase